MLNKTGDLKDRVEARRHMLMARLSELDSDLRPEATETRDKINVGLDELAGMIQDGWHNLTAVDREELDRWIDRN